MGVSTVAFYEIFFVTCSTLILNHFTSELGIMRQD